MPVIRPDEVDNYKPQSDFDFLQLKDDGDIAKVRFYIESIDDVKMYVVHKVTAKNGKTRYVNCLRTYDQPIDDCPFCREALQNKEMRTEVKMFLPVLDMDDNRVKIFERGRTFYKELEGHVRRNSPLSNYPCEIERNGAKGSTDTVYKVFPLAQEKDNTLIKDMPEEPELLNGYILEMTIDEMEEFLSTGVLPNANEEPKEELPRRTRRGGAESSTDKKEEQTTQRATRRTASRF